jgi:2TM domain
MELNVNNNNYNQNIRQAEQRVKAKIGFVWHFRVYLVLNLIALVNYIVNSVIIGGFVYFWLPWFWVLLTGGLACHYLAVFKFTGEGFHNIINREFWRSGAEEINLQTVSEAEYKAKTWVGFYWHLTAFAIVNTLCLISYFVPSLHLGEMIYPWFLWVLGATGVGLFCHYLWVELFAGRVRDKLLEKELRKH